MTRIQWLTCWDRLRESLSTRTTWGRRQILDEMMRIEREVVRESEIEPANVVTVSKPFLEAI